LPAPVQAKDLLFAALAQPPLTESPTFWVASLVETKSIWREVPEIGGSNCTKTRRRRRRRKKKKNKEKEKEEKKKKKKRKGYKVVCCSCS